MDKLNPSFQDTPVTPQSVPSVGSWYTTESTGGIFTQSQVAFMHAQGWKTLSSVTSGGQTTYFMSRRVVKPESILQSLVSDYTAAYNEGRQLNDQRYDDLLVLYTAVLDKSEDSYNTLETEDDAYEILIASILASITSDHAAWDADTSNDLDDWGTGQLLEINARFDAELGKAKQSLVDRGLFSSTMWTTISAGVERERSRALANINDTITQRQLEQKNRIYNELNEVRGRVLAGQERLRGYLRGAKDRQVAVRNAVAEALGRLVERRSDTYPSLAEVGRLASALGAGSAEAFAP